MRYFSLCLIFFTTTCFGQRRSKPRGQAPATSNHITTTANTDTAALKQTHNDTAKAVSYQSTLSETSKKIYINDTTFFSIHVVANGYETILKGDVKNFKTDKDLDGFIALNKPVINTKKIFIITSPGDSFAKIKPLLEILKAHQFYEFQVVAE